LLWQSELPALPGVHFAKAKENTRNLKISGVILELLGGFEPPTSSLPSDFWCFL